MKKFETLSASQAAGDFYYPAMKKLIALIPRLCMQPVFPLLCIVALALFLRIWGITFGLPGIDHGDESEVVNHAVRFGGGDLNPHRFQYGSLFQYFLFVLYCIYFMAGYATGVFESVHRFAVRFVQDPTVFYLIARSCSALLGAATAAVVYSIGKQIQGRAIGLAAALFLACSYEHVMHSHYCTVDAALTFMFTLGVYASLLLFRRADTAQYLRAGFIIGLACAVKFNGVFASVALLAAHFLRETPEPFVQRFFSKKLLIGLCSIIAGHFAGSPFFYVDLSTALRETAQLHAMHAAPSATLMLYVQHMAGSFWGIPLGLVCVLGLLHAAARGGRQMMVLCLTAAAVLLFASRYRYVEAKYILCSFPLFAVFGAHTVMRCCSRLKPWAVLPVMVIVLSHPLWLIASWDAARAEKSISLQAREWIEATLPRGAKILLDNVGNDGPKLANAPENIRRQYERALQHQLLKADYLKLQMEATPDRYYSIVQVDCAAGSRDDDYRNYRLWQDLEQIGKPAAYYREKGFQYIILTDRYFAAVPAQGFILVKEFARGTKAIRVYRLDD